MTTSSCSHKRAFTLIELLTVIAIIGVLVGILIPAISGIRKKAGTTQTVSNLRQIYACFELHANDNKGLWPAPRDDNGREWSLYKLYPYTTDGRAANSWDDLEGTIFTSPNALDVGKKYPGGSATVADASNQGFGMNCFLPSSDGSPYQDLGGGQFVSPEKRSPRPSLEGSAARQMLLMDCNARIILGHEGFKIQYIDYTESRHDGMNTILFCDGHTELIEHERFSSSHPEPLFPWWASGTDAGYFWVGY